jgi:hypothetical protein
MMTAPPGGNATLLQVRQQGAGPGGGIVVDHQYLLGSGRVRGPKLLTTGLHPATISVAALGLEQAEAVRSLVVCDLSTTQAWSTVVHSPAEPSGS